MTLKFLRMVMWYHECKHLQYLCIQSYVEWRKEYTHGSFWTLMNIMIEITIYTYVLAESSKARHIILDVLTSWPTSHNRKWRMNSFGTGSEFYSNQGNSVFFVVASSQSAGCCAPKRQWRLWAVLDVMSKPSDWRFPLCLSISTFQLFSQPSSWNRITEKTA